MSLAAEHKLVARGRGPHQDPAALGKTVQPGSEHKASKSTKHHELPAAEENEHHAQHERLTDEDAVTNVSSSSRSPAGSATKHHQLPVADENDQQGQPQRLTDEDEARHANSSSSEGSAGSQHNFFVRAVECNGGFPFVAFVGFGSMLVAVVTNMYVKLQRQRAQVGRLEALLPRPLPSATGTLGEVKVPEHARSVALVVDLDGLPLC